MDTSVLPALSALTVFVVCFRPLVRRAGPHTNMWFAGWGFLLIHYLALLVSNGQEGTRDLVRVLVAILALQMCALCFILAASNARITRTTQILASELGLAVFFQTGVYMFDPKSHAWNVISALLFLMPGLHLLVFPQHRTRHSGTLPSAVRCLGRLCCPSTGRTRTLP